MKIFNVVLASLIFLLAVVSAVFSFFLFEIRSQLVDNYTVLGKQIAKSATDLDKDTKTGVAAKVTVQELSHSNSNKLPEVLKNFDELSSYKKLEALKAYYEANKYLVDLTTVNESDLAQMIYTTVNVVDSGRMSGTVVADNDQLAACVATIARNLIKNNEMLADVAPEVKEGQTAAVVIKGSTVSVRYVAYAG